MSNLQDVGVKAARTPKTTLDMPKFAQLMPANGWPFSRAVPIDRCACQQTTRLYHATDLAAAQRRRRVGRLRRWLMATSRHGAQALASGHGARALASRHDTPAFAGGQHHH